MAIHGTGWVRPKVVTNELRTVGDVPVVTIFGAGIAGLSLAHELVEYGFGVQVIEAEPHPDREYAVRIGGLAANQYGRIPAEIERLHPYLFSDDGRGADGDPPIGRHVEIRLGSHREEGRTLIVIVEDCPPIEFKTGVNPTLQEVKDALDAIPSIKTRMVAGTNPNPDVLEVRAKVDSKVSPPDPLSQQLPSITVFEHDGTEAFVSKELLVESPQTLLAVRGESLKPVQRRYPIVERIQFHRSPPGQTTFESFLDDRGVANKAKIERIAASLLAAYEDYSSTLSDRLKEVPSVVAAQMTSRMRAREAFFVEICGYTDGDGDAAANRALSLGWARDVRANLIKKLNGKLDLGAHSVAIGFGSNPANENPQRGRGRRACNRVEVRIVERVIPGEHGYRYFPRFYRNLFNTMKRTPVLDANGHATGETAFDRLVPTEAVDVASKPPYEGPRAIPIRGVRTLEGLRRLIADLLQREELRIPARDVLRFTAKMIQYATSSEQRRRLYEKQTWHAFVDLRRYGKEMQDLLNLTPEALVGMNAKETDARTQGTILLQLMLDMVTMDGLTNATLSGPSSEAWLEDWKRYLSRQGVRFFRGRVARLAWKDENTLLPVTTVDRARNPRVLIAVHPDVTPGTRAICRLDGRDFDLTASGPEDRLGELEKQVSAIVGTDGAVYAVEVIRWASILAISRKDGAPVVATTSGDGIGVVGAEPEVATHDFASPYWYDTKIGTGADFFVLAVPYLEASRLVWGANRRNPSQKGLDGCFGELLSFDEHSGRKDGVPVEPDRDAWGRPLDRDGKTWPLRDLSGIQFYFDRQARIGTAHTYYLDATWGLSSISQIAYWRERMGRESAFLGQLSVDIGRWYWHGEGIRTSAWRTSRQQIAEEVWDQVRLRLEELPAKDGSQVDRILPAYYHLDSEIRFDGDENGRVFSRARIAISGNDPSPIALRIDGRDLQQVEHATKLAEAAENASNSAAILTTSSAGPVLVLGGVISGEESIVVVFDTVVVGAKYRVCVDGRGTEVTAGESDEEKLGKELEKAINQNLAGASAKYMKGAGGVGSGRLRISTHREAKVSVVALDPKDEDRHCIAVYPTGSVRVLPDPGNRTAYANADQATPSRNTAPFLINAAGESQSGHSIWSFRPGHSASPGGASRDGHGSKSRIFYRPTRGNWLMVGNHMATWTRLSTMESANESARHAAISILHEVLKREDAGLDRVASMRGANRLLGDLPHIWNPEENELEDADPLKRLDERLLKEGLQHFMEILGIEEAIDGEPWAAHWRLSGEDLVTKLLALIQRHSNEDWKGVARGAVESLRKLLDVPDL